VIPTTRSANLICTAIGVAACGGGGDGGGGNGNGGGGGTAPSPVADVSPGGIFFGPITGCSTVCPIDVVMMVSENGEWMSVNPDFEGGVNIGRMTVDGTAFDSDRRFYTGVSSVFGFGPTSPAGIDSPDDFRAFNGNVAERSSIEGTFRHLDSSNVSVDVTYNAQYDEDSSLQALAGTYSLSHSSGFTMTYVIDENGAISGTDSSGCTAIGQAQAEDPQFNLYSMSVDFSGCGANGAQGTHTGMASLLDLSGTERLFFYALSADETEMVVLALPRM